MSDNMRHWITLLEGNVEDLGAYKAARAKAKVGTLVSKFQAYLDRLEQYKAAFGAFQPMLDDYRDTPGPDMVPAFRVEVEFDRIATPAEKRRLRRTGFTIWSDSPEWGTPIHDDEDGSWANGAYFPEHGRNWYTQTEAEKQITLELAKKLWLTRNQPLVQARYGLYRAEDVHYQKSDLRGTPEQGWDIRSHPRHSEHFLGDKCFRITLKAPEYSRDTAIRDDAMLRDAMRVYTAIDQAERIRLSGATNVRSLREMNHNRHRGTLDEVQAAVPDCVGPCLYHATFARHIAGIMRDGLGAHAGQRPNFDVSRQGVVYLTDHPDVAENYAKEAATAKDDDDEIVVVKVDQRQLDPALLHADENDTGVMLDMRHGDDAPSMWDDGSAQEGGEPSYRSFQYHGVIPPSALSVSHTI